MPSEIERLRALTETCLAAARTISFVKDAIRLCEIAAEALARAVGLEAELRPQGQ
jgi:hypothetical protein